MKKIILGIAIVLIIIVAYEYQKPIKTSGYIVNKAIECANNPPKRLHIKYSTPPNFTLDNTKVYTILINKNGFLNELTNKRQWEVKLYQGADTTVTLDAYSGKCLSILGPLT